MVLLHSMTHLPTAHQDVAKDYAYGHVASLKLFGEVAIMNSDTFTYFANGRLNPPFLSSFFQNALLSIHQDPS